MPANQENVQSISRIAASAVSQYRYLSVDANGKVAHATTGDRADMASVGSASADDVLECAIGGRVLIELGGTVAAGATLQATTDGKGLTQTSTNPVMGTALEGGVSGDIISTIFAPQGAP